MSDWLLLEHGTVLDVTGGVAVADCPVLIEDDQIVAVGSDAGAERVPRGDALTRIDATGLTVMPGLIDAHCHLSFGESRTQEEQDLYTSVELRTLRSASNAVHVLRAGVTGVSDPGSSFNISIGLREAINEGLIIGPRVFSAGRFITTSNGLGVFYPGTVGEPQGAIGTIADTLDEMKATVRAQVKAGVDLIKLSDSVSGEFEAFTPDEIADVTELAHRLRRRVTIHARGSENVDAAVRAGVDWIMHGNVMTDDVIERLAASRIPLCPSLTLCLNFSELGHLVGVPVAARDRWRRVMDASAVSLHKAHEAGVRMISGTDSGFAVTPYGEWHARELRALMDYAGLSTADAIRAATTNAAVTLGLEGRVGEIAPGMLADVIAVRGNPLEDVRVLERAENIVHVVKGGRVVDFGRDDAEPAPRHPYDGALVYSTGVLTRAVVDRSPEPVPPEHVERPVDGGDLARDLRAAAAGARLPD